MWTEQHANELARYANEFGLPVGDEHARQWTLRLAEHFAFAFPSEGWGTKRADMGRPMSTDVICTRSPFVGYDVLLNQGTPGQRIDTQPRALDLAGQVFIAVTPHNHLGPRPVPVPPKPVEPPKPQYPGDAYFRDALGKVLAADYAARPQAMDDGAVVWAARVIFDHVANGMPLDAAITKHRNGPGGWRLALGLPPL